MRLLDRFAATFEGVEYHHRRSTLGDAIAQELFEDLLALGDQSSRLLTERVRERSRLVNRSNQARGRVARRGDGTFGERVPSAEAVIEDGFAVARGEIATVEIGVEVKILATAMLKQVNRVSNDLREQPTEFKEGGRNAICVGVVGINFAPQYQAFEKRRTTITDGREYKHPVDEASVAEQRLVARVEPAYDELLVLRFSATNMEPFHFEWVNRRGTELDYSAALLRISRLYNDRFPQ